MTVLEYPVAIVAAILWIGFVGAISFMESWLKFKAPGISVKLGLGIGRLVFSALNKIELILAIAIMTNLVVEGDIFIFRNLLFFVPLLLLVVQTLWLLPALDIRAKILIGGEELSPTYLHFYYVGMEIMKVGCLLSFSVNLLYL
ncbi:hypothetical protein C7S20_18905 [Christiangramia fulva]|uniref:DUF4149 domain-containing protein n=1 Tax=Christiangramia fulva TaxID=2126553 RepID=A0A2R3ZA62_9FLAO|nr:hypothetical protein [Christiangramia fulva]AVR47151.1 hypothetical protein C7S20_18905 [Christiangramia fulva]